MSPRSRPHAAAGALLLFLALLLLAVAPSPCAARHRPNGSSGGGGAMENFRYDPAAPNIADGVGSATYGGYTHSVSADAWSYRCAVAPGCRRRLLGRRGLVASLADGRA